MPVRVEAPSFRAESSHLSGVPRQVLVIHGRQASRIELNETIRSAVRKGHDSRNRRRRRSPASIPRRLQRSRLPAQIPDPAPVRMIDAVLSGLGALCFASDSS
jgi:hypothetical protein